MFSVLLFARNARYIEILKTIYDWRNNGFSNVYEHTNEDSAISAITAKTPDLLVIDAQIACMLHMEFLYKARTVIPRLKIILLTSEKSFSIAQAAFDLRVDALFVWDELDGSAFASKINLVLSELDEQIHRRGIVKRQLFRDILKGKIPTDREVENYFEIRGVRPWFVMIRIVRDAPHRILGTEIVPFVEYYTVNWHGCSFPSNMTYIATVNTSMHSWCSLFLLGRISSTAQIHSLTFTTALMLQNAFNQQFQDTVSVVFCQPFSDFNDISGIISRMDDCLALQKYYGRAQVNSVQDFPPSHGIDENRLQTEISVVEDALEKGSRANTIQYLTQLFTSLRADSISPASLRAVCDKLLELLKSYCKKHHILAVYNDWIESQKNTNDKYSLDDIMFWFCDGITMFFEQRRPEPQSVQSHKIQQIIDYIEQNYAINENIPEIASRFHLSGDYLRHLFKEETGEGLSAFITKVRIEKSKSFLSTGRFKISEVANMVGFNSTQYFGTVFRKQVGMSPREYVSNNFSQNAYE